MAWHVTGAKGLPLGDRKMAWSASDAEKRCRVWAGGAEGPSSIDWKKYNSCFMVSDGSNRIEGAKLGFCDIIDGKQVAIPRGVFACAGALQSSALPDPITAVAKAFSEAYFSDMEVTPPWKKAAAGEVEFKSLPWECKVDTSHRMLQGYASTWQEDDGGDVINPGAFLKTIQERGPRMVNGQLRSEIKVLWQHCPMLPIGLPTVLQEDSKGLYVEGRVSRTKCGDDAMELMGDGTIDTLSIGYTAMKWMMEQPPDENAYPLRRITEMKLYEFSPVTWPMNGGAQITGVKEADFMLKMLLGANEQDALAGIADAMRRKNLDSAKSLWQALETLAKPPQSLGHLKTDVKPPQSFIERLQALQEASKAIRERL